MKKIISTLIALGVAGYILPATAQTAADNNNNTPPDQAAPPSADNTAPGAAAGPAAGAPDAAAAPPDMPGQPADAGADQSGDQSAPGSSAPALILPSQPLGLDKTVRSDFAPPTDYGTNSNDLDLNFKNAPIDMVLNYLSDAAGFIIVLDTRVGGTVSVTGKHLTRDEAVDLLNSVLNKNGYAAIRNDRTLTIVDKHDAMTQDIPVKVSNNPNEIPKNDEIVTQIIPIRFVEARQLVSDLSSFVSAQATVVANEAGNSIVITDTQSNIRHLVEIIKAIDDSAEAETEIRVFHLKYASPTDVATELGNVFPSGGGSGGSSQSPIRFGGGGFGGGGGGNPFARLFGGGGGGQGGGGNAAGGGSNDRIKKETQVTAVADARIQAVIVTAPKDLMAEIAGMMTDLDVPSDRDQKVYVFKMNNGDPQQALSVLQGMFQSSSSRNSSSSSQTSPLTTRANNNASTTTTTGSSTGIGGSTGGGGGGRGGAGGF